MKKKKNPIIQLFVVKLCQIGKFWKKIIFIIFKFATLRIISFLGAGMCLKLKIAFTRPKNEKVFRSLKYRDIIDSARASKVL